MHNDAHGGSGNGAATQAWKLHVSFDRQLVTSTVTGSIPSVHFCVAMARAWLDAMDARKVVEVARSSTVALTPTALRDLTRH